MQNVDSVTLELIKGAIRSARKEMEALVDRTSMSPFIREKLVRIVTAGGSWGSQLERPVEQALDDVPDDVPDGFVPLASARDDFGAVLDEDGLAVDGPATEARRQRLAGPTAMRHRGSYFSCDEPREAAG